MGTTPVLLTVVPLGFHIMASAYDNSLETGPPRPPAGNGPLCMCGALGPEWEVRVENPGVSGSLGEEAAGHGGLAGCLAPPTILGS